MWSKSGVSVQVGVLLPYKYSEGFISSALNYLHLVALWLASIYRTKQAAAHCTLSNTGFTIPFLLPEKQLFTQQKWESETCARDHEGQHTVLAIPRDS